MAPFTVKVKAASPAVLLFGNSVLTVGTGLLTVNDLELDVPPPGAGLETVIGNVPVAAISGAGISAVNCVELTRVVARASPLKLRTELLLKFVPVAISVNAPVPTI